MELEELARLTKIRPEAILSKPILPLGTELDIAKDALVGMRTIRIAERDITLPGLTRNTDLILQVLADFKDKKKRNFMPTQFAKADDIVMEALRPEQFTANAVTLDNWEQKALTVGEQPILPSVLQDAGGDVRVISVDENEVFVITDWIEMKPTAIITALQAEIDGTPYNPAEMRLPMRATDLLMFELDYPWVCDVSLDIDGKCEFAGDSELTPFGCHIALGKLVKGIT